MTLLSVIIPFFNSADTLERMLACLPQAALRHSVEYIFVDDASVDEGPAMVEQFIGSHPGISAKLIVNQRNEGVSSAFSKGLDVATGRYITRLDADDFLENQAFDVMLDLAESNGYPIVVAAAHFNHRPPKKPRLRIPLPTSDLNVLPPDNTHFALWAKIISRTFLVENRIAPRPGVDCWEDLLMVAQIYALTDSVVFTDRPVYHYFDDPRRPSLSRCDKLKVTADRIFHAKEIEEKFTREGISEAYRPFLDRIKFHAKIKLLRSPNRDIGRWVGTFPEINRRVMSIEKVPWLVRAGALAVSLFHPRLNRG